MAESEQKSLFVLYVLDELWNVLLLSDLLEHPEHSLVSASVLWAI